MSDDAKEVARAIAGTGNTMSNENYAHKLTPMETSWAKYLTEYPWPASLDLQAAYDAFNAGFAAGWWVIK